MFTGALPLAYALLYTIRCRLLKAKVQYAVSIQFFFDYKFGGFHFCTTHAAADYSFPQSLHKPNLIIELHVEYLKK